MCIKEDMNINLVSLYLQNFGFASDFDLVEETLINSEAVIRPMTMPTE